MEALPQGSRLLFRGAENGAWANEKARHTAQEAAGIAEETHTWAGWKRLGYEVRHESKVMYQTIITDPGTKSGTRRVCNFYVHALQETDKKAADALENMLAKQA